MYAFLVPPVDVPPDCNIAVASLNTNTYDASGGVYTSEHRALSGQRTSAGGWLKPRLDSARCLWRARHEGWPTQHHPTLVIFRRVHPFPIFLFFRPVDSTLHRRQRPRRHPPQRPPTRVNFCPEKPRPKASNRPCSSPLARPNLTTPARPLRPRSFTTALPLRRCARHGGHDDRDRPRLCHRQTARR